MFASAQTSSQPYPYICRLMITVRALLPWDHPATPAASYQALAAAEKRLGAALGRIDALLLQNSLLRQAVIRLEEASIKARLFAYHDELTGLPN